MKIQENQLPETWLNKGQNYLNKKTGATYTVMGFANHSETQECLVLYHRNEGPLKSRVWALPQDLFYEKFTLLNGAPICRQYLATGLLEDGI